MRTLLIISLDLLIQFIYFLQYTEPCSALSKKEAEAILKAHKIDLVATGTTKKNIDVVLNAHYAGGAAKCTESNRKLALNILLSIKHDLTKNK